MGWAVTVAIIAGGTGISSFIHPAPKLIWNASASVPVGLYIIYPAGNVQIGELLAVPPPASLAAFLDERHYLPKGVPLLGMLPLYQGKQSAASECSSRLKALRSAWRSAQIICVAPYLHGEAAKWWLPAKSSS